MARSSIIPSVIEVLKTNGPMTPKQVLTRLDDLNVEYLSDKSYLSRQNRLGTAMGDAMRRKIPVFVRDKQHRYSLPNQQVAARQPKLKQATEHWQPKPALSPQAAFLTRNLLETPTVDRVIVEQELQIEGKQYLLVRCL